MTNDSTQDRIERANELGRRCDGHPENVDAVLPPLLALLAGEEEPAVLAAIADAFGRIWDRRCVAPLVRIARHPEHDVRLAATQALNGAMSNAEDPGGIEMLLGLMRDAWGDIRDWATFALAQCGADSPAIRAALWERTNDPEGATAGEAIVGLARRKDPHVERVIADELEDWPGNLIVEAAGELADPRLYPLLVGLRDRGWQLTDQRPMVLEEALLACAPDAAQA